ncbi:Cytochrome c [Pragia fontium]|uniref:c-type cytochrome n=1 Tax=Pragia fontium TaxID=82985 RepID=UPI000B11F025|nr:c-type cytochrome [Pragia fontium]SUB82784.1 Cytochrome c [Pragia fontium]
MMVYRSAILIVGVLVITGGTITLSSWQSPTSPQPETTQTPAQPAIAPVELASVPFNQAPIPDNEFGKIAEQGKMIFNNPSLYASQYVGNSLTCSNCHLDSGTKAGSAPLWAAYVSYPAYRSKNNHVNSFQERLQGCFRFSMNGKAPALGSPELVALESYAWWLAKGTAINPDEIGRGFTKLSKPAKPADYARGQIVYQERCAMCHAADGSGQTDNNGHVTFPALWGDKSFNWGAGMGSITNAAAFIRANMPYSQGNTLSIQQSWDVALYMDSHDRPQDPRFTGSVEETRQKYHNSASSMYGKVVNGSLLGSVSTPSGGRLNEKEAQ